jgi:hypothetical protein
MNSMDSTQRHSSLLEELFDLEPRNSTPMSSDSPGDRGIHDTSELARTFQQFQANQRSLTRTFLTENTGTGSRSWKRVAK